MKVVSALALVTVATGCGQTGSLYLPDESVETPVEIRTPGELKDDDEEKKSTQPPGR
ncbi:MAG: LPS translocon maturation chaperone LptM [Steroidobacteraceae bacterium]